jgi:hypothetical protein
LFLLSIVLPKLLRTNPLTALRTVGNLLAMSGSMRLKIAKGGRENVSQLHI